MAIFPSSMPVFDFFRDDDEVFVCEMTAGMVRQLHALLDESTEIARENGQWVPPSIVALTKQLGNAARDRGTGAFGRGADRPGFTTPRTNE